MTELNRRIPTAAGPPRGRAVGDGSKKCRMCGCTIASPEAGPAEGRVSKDRGRGSGRKVAWATCSKCRAGLRAYLGTLQVRPRALRRIASYASVHVRIGELLKEFGIGKRAPSSLIESTAGQRSWKSRLRELRQPPFGWRIAALRYRSSSGRIRCDYILLRDRPWPDGLE